MKTEDIKIKDMGKYRSVWMGIAMIWIVVYHSQLHLSNPVLLFVKKIGYGGVDIFLFAAGLGSYYSYLKDHSPLDYLRRRIIRLAPVYVPFILVWLIVKLVFYEMSIFKIIGNFFGIQGFSYVGGEFNWYLTVIIICYLLTPYLASFIEQNKMGKNVILILFLLLISTVFWNDRRMIISITRLPIYALGMIFAKYDKKTLTKKFIFYESILFVCGSMSLYLAYQHASAYLWNYGLHWYPFILMTPFVCHIVSLVSAFMTKNKVGNKFIALLAAVGNYSFEIYLVHIFLFEFVKVWISNNTTGNNNSIWLFAFIILIPCVMLLRLISHLLIYIFGKLQRRNKNE
ncbi:MAG: acyltransferase [Lachnospiraceae bacterium]|nr:acyltransferase [Lachnospiraceae bacterium]